MTKSDIFKNLIKKETYLQHKNTFLEIVTNEKNVKYVTPFMEIFRAFF